MPVQITHFDDVRLMEYNPQQDHSPNAAASAFIDSIGGFFDRYGDDDARPQRQTIPVTGLVWGEDTFMTDSDDGTFVDDGSDSWIVGDGPTMLRSGVTALRDKVRKLGTLWRLRLDGTTVREWKTARFLRMSQPQTVQDRVFKAHVTCEFETDMTNWHAEEAVTFSGSMAAGVDTDLVVDNPGATVNDAILTVTRTSGTITNLFFACAELGIVLSWIGSLGAGDVLVIDEGAHTVLKNGANAYIQFSILGSVKGWMPIQAGSYTFLVQVTGGDATVEVSFFNQFA